MTEGPGITYRDAGVDIDAGDELVERIKPLVRRAQRREVLAGIGGFAALVELPPGYQRPVLVSGTDGVGTKLRLAIDSGRHDTIGIDLVAMCANDVVVQGAEPLFFLDYYATGKLRVAVAEAVVRGIVEGCVQAGAALVGGETAEMPGMYHGEDYDLAGFCVGVVEKDAIIDGSRVSAGDAIIGLASSGPHANGYSLIRKLLAAAGATATTALEGHNLIDRLLTPTRIYVKPLLALLRAMPVHGLAHITGGGLSDNLPRVLPEGLEAVLERRSWHRDPVFDWLQRAGRIEPAQMYRTFNCGVGMVVIVPPERAAAAVELLAARGGDLRSRRRGGSRQRCRVGYRNRHRAGAAGWRQHRLRALAGGRTRRAPAGCDRARGFHAYSVGAVRRSLPRQDVQYSPLAPARVPRPAYPSAGARVRRHRAWRKRAFRDRGARRRAGGAAVQDRGATRRHRSHAVSACSGHRAHHLSARARVVHAAASRVARGRRVARRAASAGAHCGGFPCSNGHLSRV